jgi:Mg/Co/Ni transporter MgtE
MITGSSDVLCAHFGWRRYQLLLGFLPLTCAISGNIGLQAVDVTMRAISHNHVTSASYRSWFVQEVGVAAGLGLGMGTILGIIAYVASRQDFAFGITIFITQFFSSITAGITGTLGPLLCSFIVKRDCRKWSTLLITTIQDLFGCFVVVIASYYIFTVFTDGDVDASDSCTVVDKRS